MKKYFSGVLLFLLLVSPLAGFAQIPATNVCVGTSIALSDTVLGGAWSGSNVAAASISGGAVTGIAAGVDTVRYIVSNSCGADTASLIVYVIPQPQAGIISGSSTLMVGTLSMLTDSVLGGAWSCSNAAATVSGGVVLGVSAGLDTVIYTVSNFCGSVSVSRAITINPVPNAGNIVGAGSVCVGTSITMTDTVGVGVWSSSNMNASIVGGVVTGVSAGLDTIRYIVVNAGGIDTADLAITVNPLPFIASITGASSVCMGAGVTLTDAAMGGVWSVTNAHAVVSGGIVKGISAGADTVRYEVANMCGVGIATTTVTIDPLPVAGAITGATVVGVGSSVTLTDASPLGNWSSSNGDAEVFGGVVTGLLPGLDTIRYTLSNACGADTALLVIAIKPKPNAGTITGLQNVCVGGHIEVTDTVAGGQWAATNNTANVQGGLVTGIIAGLDTILYVVTNAGGTDTATLAVTVHPTPAKPTITTQGPASVCTGTLFQNYGTNIAAPLGVVYSWSAMNAVVWATGTYGQNALISFPYPGNAEVILTANSFGTDCESSDSVAVTVQTTTAIVPKVFYFQYNFVCLPANLPAYQWGYDDVVSLASTTIVGAINQDYQDKDPDFAHKYYWVNTTEGDCIQKTYYNQPLALTGVNQPGPTEIVVYPNPAHGFINVEINTPLLGAMVLQLVNITGQKLGMTSAAGHAATIDISMYPPGFYILECRLAGVVVASAKVVKE